jgi:hypothetical protein
VKSVGVTIEFFLDYFAFLSLSQSLFTFGLMLFVMSHENWSNKRGRGKSAEPIITDGKHEAIIPDAKHI